MELEKQLILSLKTLKCLNFELERITNNLSTLQEDGITGESYTYGQAGQLHKSFGSALKRQGYKKNDTMAILLTNSINYMVCLTGATGVGVIATTINPGYTASEVARQFKMSHAKCALTSSTHLPVVKEAISKLGKIDKC